MLNENKLVLTVSDSMKARLLMANLNGYSFLKINDEHELMYTVNKRFAGGGKNFGQGVYLTTHKMFTTTKLLNNCVLSKLKAYVLGDHTLGLIKKPSSHGMYFERLNGLVSKGGMSIIDAPRLVKPAEIRPATLADFETFNVKYHEDYGIED